MHDDNLIMTTTVDTKKGPISGTRQFSRYDLDNLMDMTPIASRRGSYCTSPNLSRRGSVNIPPHPFLRRGSTDVPPDECLQIPPKFGSNLHAPENQGHIRHRRPSIEISQCK